MTPGTAFIWSDELAGYRFGPRHPLDPRRLELTVDLVRRLGLLERDDVEVIAPRPATDDELRRVHDAGYVEAVRRLSRPGADPRDGVRWGLGTEDNPLVEGMHEMAAHAAGASLTAAESLLDGRAVRAFSVAGGLHHAHRDRASGFCVYSDLALAIDRFRREGARVLYLDVDAHHGDGVQQIFYRDPDVLTVSFHESGLFLFPGTGYIDEQGAGDGYGFAVNVPLDPDTGDDSFLRLYRELVPELVRGFRPDALVLQCGCDSHWLDPLTHLRCTTRLVEEATALARELADAECGGRLLVTGGGGYAVHRVVPRAWALAWAALLGEAPPAELPPEWVAAVSAESGRAIPGTLRDPPELVPPTPRHAEMEHNNLRTLETVRRQALPLLSGWGLGF
jgi:acetoin utilization protein AcuC